MQPISSNEAKQIVFLSYAHEDLSHVKWEADTMKIGGLDVFLDVQSLRTGTEPLRGTGCDKPCRSCSM